MNGRVDRANFEEYKTFLKDKHRPPSRGGNTHAWHQHVLKIKGEIYSFLALGATKWAYVGDQISFDWEWDATQKYRNVKSENVQVWDKKGEPVVRGKRGSKPWRKADTRMPASHREQRD